MQPDIRTGLVSVTFRQLDPFEVVALAAKAGLQGIEWGGDVHVPPGDLAHAREVAKRTQDAGLETVSYGSYYRLDEESFEPILETALALSAPNIRIWAGKSSSVEATEEMWSAAVGKAQEAETLAGAAGVRLSLEFHNGTLADTAESTLKLIQRVGSPYLRSYWQPLAGRSPEQCEGEIETLGPALSHLHVFQWKEGERQPLSAGAEAWKRYLRKAGGPRYALLEFVKDDSPDQFAEDAKTLHRWIGGLA